MPLSVNLDIGTPSRTFTTADNQGAQWRTAGALVLPLPEDWGRDTAADTPMSVRAMTIRERVWWLQLYGDLAGSSSTGPRSDIAATIEVSYTFNNVDELASVSGSLSQYQSTTDRGAAECQINFTTDADGYATFASNLVGWASGGFGVVHSYSLILSSASGGAPAPTDKPLYLGADKITRLYLGANQLEKLYLGSTEIFVGT